jgi:hypothetical protein
MTKRWSTRQREEIEGGLNHDLIVQAGVERDAEAARVDEVALVDAVPAQKAYPRRFLRGSGRLVIGPDGSVEVVDVPKTLQKTRWTGPGMLIGAACSRIGKFIHATGETGFSHGKFWPTSPMLADRRLGRNF